MPPGGAALQIVDINEEVARQLLAGQRVKLVSETLGQTKVRTPTISKGDTPEVEISEAPPALLFGGGATDARNPLTLRQAALPEQVVDRDHPICVPFAGRVRAIGQTVPRIEAEIVRRLQGKVNYTAGLVWLVRNESVAATGVGEVGADVLMPLTENGERLLYVLASAGGGRQSVSKMTLQLTRGDSHQALQLNVVIRDPKQNLRPNAGGVITAIFQPLSFMALGAMGKSEEINFEAQGIDLGVSLS